jgi:TRAP-type C4-dicarboxylate transport system permease small subunit
MCHRHRNVRTVERVSRILNRVFAAAGGAALVCLTGLAAANMLCRAVYRPVPGSYELIGFICALGVAFGMGYTQLHKGHVVVSILTERFSIGVNRVLDALNHLVGAGFFGLVSWQTLKWGVEIAKSGELSETLKIPYYPVIYGVALGFAVYALTLLLDLILVFTPAEQKQ